MVLLVHGGPWARDGYGFNSLHQLLANRGYAVLSTNFRGSTGFGKDFINAGNLQWGLKMHDDLIDAVDWAVGHGITGADQVARSEEHTSELQSLMRISYAVFCLKKKTKKQRRPQS